MTPDDEPGEMVADELAKALRARGLTLRTDDQGYRVVAEEVYPGPVADDEVQS